jgi:isopentenyl-diphosphate delta-isomerase
MKNQEFIHRKIDHLRIALKEESQATLRAEWSKIELAHDSLPDLNLADIKLTSLFLDHPVATPFFVAGMTAGHPDADQINDRLASVCAERGWIFGLGSQRRELDSEFSDHLSHELMKRYPDLKLVSNLGIAQLIEIYSRNDWNRLQEVLSRTGSAVIAIHLNPLQEAVQEEGTPRFKGGLQALEALKAKLSVPFLLKETGSGMSTAFLKRVQALDPFAVDVSGLGGTHWGRVEGLRAKDQSISQDLGETFKDWGVGTLTSVLNAAEVFRNSKTEIWASGGVRNGLDAAKCMALGAKRVGFAKPALQAAMLGRDQLKTFMETRETELRTALFCTNSENLSALNASKVEAMRLK